MIQPWCCIYHHHQLHKDKLISLQGHFAEENKDSLMEEVFNFKRTEGGKAENSLDTVGYWKGWGRILALAELNPIFLGFKAALAFSFGVFDAS